MKARISGLLMFVVGAAVGAYVAQTFWLRTFRSAIPSHISTLEHGQEYSCMLSVSVLAILEAGDTERAKSILAREVAGFYHHPWQADAPQRQKILELIETTKPKSAVLRQELSKTPQ
jgi:hypothetical protein